MQGYEQSSCHKCLKIFTGVPSNLGKRKPKKIKAEESLPKTSAFIFLPVGLADLS